MVTATLAFLAGVFLSWWFWVPAVLFGMYCEYSDSLGWATAWFIALVVSLGIAFGLPFSGWWLATYPIIGVAWSYWRFKRYVGYKVEQNSKRPDPDSDRYVSGRKLTAKEMREDLHPKEHLDRITHWIVVWPFSFIAHFTMDVFEFVRDFVRDHLMNMYNSIVESAVPEDPTEEP